MSFLFVAAEEKQPTATKIFGRKIISIIKPSRNWNSQAKSDKKKSSTQWRNSSSDYLRSLIKQLSLKIEAIVAAQNKSRCLTSRKFKSDALKKNVMRKAQFFWLLLGDLTRFKNAGLIDRALRNKCGQNGLWKMINESNIIAFRPNSANKSTVNKYFPGTFKA